MNRHSLHRSLCLSLAGLLAAQAINAQAMNEPYSVFGIGTLNNRTYNFNSGMGYTGIALKTSLFSTGNNPASLSRLEKNVFTLNLSGSGRLVNFSGSGIDAGNSQSK